MIEFYWTFPSLLGQRCQAVGVMCTRLVRDRSSSGSSTKFLPCDSRRVRDCFLTLTYSFQMYVFAACRANT